jgi:hypothetical protein
MEGFRELLEEIHDAHLKHVGRKQMGLDEDPWDNFLFHDSRYLLPLICHNDSLAVEK